MNANKLNKRYKVQRRSLSSIFSWIHAYLIAISLTFSAYSPASELPVVNIAKPGLPVLSLLASEEVLKEAYQRLGYQVHFIPFPTQRSLVEANLGRVDGELMRHKNITEDYPNLIKIPVSIFSEKMVVFAHNPKLIEQMGPLNWENIAPYRLGSIIGFKVAEEAAKTLKVDFVVNLETLFNKLIEGRTDFVLGTYSSGCYVKTRFGHSVFLVDGHLAEYNSYHHLHRSKSHLVKPLTDILNKMKENDEINKITKNILTTRCNSLFGEKPKLPFDRN
ncbi:transporter substrate-binding domain-containing protein [Vibrio sp. Of7-15]|uniref:transporter substrate-binding domain-containing protein n=1 Tax=Vibrio sp. Of7-15 TaxID=2724879 RepID=UPI001EF324BE|nr:transporter substrate-binding domain-containing protein [Vibrio sp. Of7-15]MCG7499958.1 transporter substrate-binding domain-containing protein [Vibrio sp. Of7-15]